MKRGVSGQDDMSHHDVVRWSNTSLAAAKQVFNEHATTGAAASSVELCTAPHRTVPVIDSSEQCLVDLASCQGLMTLWTYLRAPETTLSQLIGFAMHSC
jgi:hypothetical protein